MAGGEEETIDELRARGKAGVGVILADAEVAKKAVAEAIASRTLISDAATDFARDAAFSQSLMRRA